LAAVDESGLSLSAFAARQGIDAQRLYYWRRRLAGQQVVALPPPHFRGVLSVGLQAVVKTPLVGRLRPSRRTATIIGRGLDRSRRPRGKATYFV